MAMFTSMPQDLHEKKPQSQISRLRSVQRSQRNIFLKMRTRGLRCLSWIPDTLVIVSLWFVAFMYGERIWYDIEKQHVICVYNLFIYTHNMFLIYTSLHLNCRSSFWIGSRMNNPSQPDVESNPRCSRYRGLSLPFAILPLVTYRAILKIALFTVRSK